ncbi:outer membrane transport energization protein ExbB [Thalassoporum mexicanum PCC 7367]|uniref:MotA/TolQ/ExbB proton channel family protein n=1 Tax=Thalassoporum mexicanum TaxID=3457544 RepID=UPI00029FAFA9|nr:MotA/TolQ/ExbB proton channel family protein [Pseudanabaena sp. PCC 7367]AFY71449.1 outer membrane transport energization protein ExbB [Pseudanabaena sp. PCC 7367]
MQFSNFFATGGIVAYPLLIFSLIALGLTIERLIFWTRVVRRQKQIMRGVLSLYASEPNGAIAKLKNTAYLPMSRIFLEAIMLDRPKPDEFRLALESAAQAEIPILKRFNTMFETIINVAPLLGLLGTIIGLIKTFAALDLGAEGGIDIPLVTSGISEALVSTVMGLVVAIFTLLFASLFRSFYRRQMALIQEYSGQLELTYRRQYYQQQPQEEYATV